MKKVEIERRFLLNAVPPNLDSFKSLKIRQDYLKDKKRLRASFNVKTPGKVEYVSCEKTRISDMSNEETEFPMTKKEYSTSIKDSVKSLMKTRYLIPSGDLTFELDIFQDPIRMIILEVELPTETTSFEIPEFLKPFVICEITGRSEFSNFNLALPTGTEIAINGDTNRTFKITSVHPYTKRQYKKRVYTSEKAYLQYKGDIIKRYKRGYEVYCYELVNGAWVLLESHPYEGNYYMHKRYEQNVEESN